MIDPSPQTRLRLIPILGLGLACAGSAPTPDAESFDHDITSVERPWTNAAFDGDADKFTFAVFGDLNGGERARVFDVAVEQLSLLRPDLIVSVGDLIDAATEDVAALSAEWDDFDDRAGEASAPVFRVGGNHDLTGQVLRDVWSARYGPHYYHFLYKNVLFLVLDTEDHTDERMREIYQARARSVGCCGTGRRGRAGDGVLQYA